LRNTDLTDSPGAALDVFLPKLPAKMSGLGPRDAILKGTGGYLGYIFQRAV
jgi:hypothetical protein